MNMPVESNAFVATPTPVKPPRNPWERVAVWGGIGLLLAVVLIEYRAVRGHTATIHALNGLAANEERDASLADAMQLLAMSPAINGPFAFGPYDHFHCSWFSLFKPGQYKVTLVASRDDNPELLLFITPQPPEEPQPTPDVVAEGASTPGGMGGPGMSMGGPEGGMARGMGGPGAGAGARRPNPIRVAIDSDEDGDLSATEIAAASTALAKLDKDGDGSLSVDELTPPPPAEAALSAATAPDSSAAGDGASRPNRLVGAIDTNGDGAISAEELAAAATGLKTLDADNNGIVASDELRPPGGGGFGGPPGGGASGRPRRPGSEESRPAIPETATSPAEATPEATAVPTESLPVPTDPAKTVPAAGTP